MGIYNNYNNNNAFAVYVMAVACITVVGFLYAPFIMWFWNGLVCKLVPVVAKITYMQSYLAYLFFVVLPRIMPIRFNVANTPKLPKTQDKKANHE